MMTAPSALPTTSDPQQPLSSLSAQEVLLLREDFPVLRQLVRGCTPLVYLDNGATTQKPNPVIDRMTQFLQTDYGTVRRGVYDLSARATIAFDQARQCVARFLNAHEDEIVFTRGTTEAINLVAFSFGQAHLKPGDEIIISATEHHANLVPWQMACQRHGARLRVIPVDDRGVLDQDAYQQLFNDRTRLVAVGHVSNSLGTIHPVKAMIADAHAHGVPVLVDGAQSAPHMPVDVKDLDADFFTFSAHKIYGPTGIGVLYGKRDWLEKLPPYQGGGDMIDVVTFEETTYAPSPRRFEAGTPAIVEAIGLQAAIEYVESVGMARIDAYERHLLAYATEALADISGLRIIGQAPDKAGIISFVIQGIHPHDIGTMLDQEGIAIRAGHHCAQPVMERYGVPATARVSFGLYNTTEEVDTCVASLRRIVSFFA